MEWAMSPKCGTSTEKVLPNATFSENGIIAVCLAKGVMRLWVYVNSDISGSPVRNASRPPMAVVTCIAVVGTELDMSVSLVVCYAEEGREKSCSPRAHTILFVHALAKVIHAYCH